MLLTSCASPVTSQFRERVWERCYVAGQREIRRGNVAAAITLLRESVKQGRCFAPLDARRINTQLLLASAELAAGQIANAQAQFAEVERVTEAQSPIAHARAVAGQGHCALQQKEYPRALNLYQSAVKEFDDAKIDFAHGYDIDGRDYANALVGLSDAYLALGKPHEALAPLERAAEVSDWTIALVDWKADIRRKFLSTSFAINGERNHKVIQSLDPLWASAIERAQHAAIVGQTDSVRDAAAEAQTYLVGRQDDIIMRLITQESLAHAACMRGDYAAVEQIAQPLLHEREALLTAKYDAVCSDLDEYLASAAASRGDWSAAEIFMQKSVAIQESLGMPHPFAAACRLAQLGTYQMKLGKRDQARQALNRAEVLGSRIKGKGQGGKGFLQYWFAKYYEAAGDEDTAQMYAADALARFLQKADGHYMIARIEQEFPGVEPQRM